MTRQTGGQAVVETLVALGVERVFGIVSVHNLPIADAILRDGRITWHPVRHEQAAERVGAAEERSKDTSLFGRRCLQDCACARDGHSGPGNGGREPD